MKALNQKELVFCSKYVKGKKVDLKSLTESARKTNCKLYHKIKHRGSVPRLRFLELLYKFKFPKKKTQCRICSKPTKFRSFVYGFSEYCSRPCILRDPSVHRKARQGVMKKYGVTNISQLPSIKRKKMETCIRNHGVAHPMQSEEVRRKSVNSVRARFGVDNVSQSKTILKRKEKTWLKNYGYTNPSKAPEVREKISMTKTPEVIAKALKRAKKTNRERLGVDFPMLSPEVVKTRKRNNLEKWGVEEPASLQEVKAKIIASNRATCLERYGVTSTRKLSWVHKKGVQTKIKNGTITSYKVKTMKLEGTEIKFQGYEDVVLTYLVREKKVKMKNLGTLFHNNKKLMVNFDYGVDKTYVPDIVVDTKSGLKVIEVKSTYTCGVTNKQLLETMKDKARAVVQAGYEFHLFVCSKDKILLHTKDFKSVTQRKLKQLS